MISPTSVELKECPFCGRNPMFLRESFDSWQIICRTFDEVDSKGNFLGCGAKIIQSIPKFFPKNVFVKGNFKATDKNMGNWAYNKLVPKWNRRKLTKVKRI